MTEQQARGKRPDRVTAIAVAYLVVGVLALLAVVMILLVVIMPVLTIVEEPSVRGMSLALFGFGAVVCAGVGVAAFVVSAGLLHMQPWARWAALALSLLMLPGVPIGTAVGVYSLLYLLSDEGKAAFGIEAR